MSPVADAAAALEAALQTIAGLRVYRDPGAAVDPPAAVLGPPSLFWDSYGVDPTRAAFQVWLVEPADERAVERLWDVVPAVARALAGVNGAAVSSSGATPGTWSAGGVDLPAYAINVDVPLPRGA